MGACSPVPRTSLRACSRTPLFEDGDVAGEKWLRPGVFLEKSISHLFRSRVIRMSLTHSAQTHVVGVTLPSDRQCSLPRLTWIVCHPVSGSVMVRELHVSLENATAEVQHVHGHRCALPQFSLA